MKRTVSILCCFLVTLPLFSWNARGHMIIAAIAYQELSDEQQASITNILISHPEYDREWKTDYQQVKNDVELGLYLFMKASIWADKIRSNKHPSNHNTVKTCMQFQICLRILYIFGVKPTIYV